MTYEVNSGSTEKKNSGARGKVFLNLFNLGNGETFVWDEDTKSVKKQKWRVADRGGNVLLSVP